MKWISVFYANIKSCVMINETRSGFFRVYTGCRQGDPLSPYLFLLGVEILGHKLSKSKNIRGVSAKDGELRNFYYADDCSIFLHPDDNNLRKYSLCF